MRVDACFVVDSGSTWYGGGYGPFMFTLWERSLLLIGVEGLHAYRHGGVLNLARAGCRLLLAGDQV